MLLNRIKIKQLLNDYFPLLFVVEATLIMVLFTYLTPPVLNKPIFTFLAEIDSLDGDYAVYISRFMLSFILMGLLPLITARLCGCSLNDLGLNFRISPFKTWQILIFFLIALLSGISGGISGELAEFYPYSHTLVEDFSGGSRFLLPLHLLLYGGLYYLPWELFFRGFLMLAFINKFEKSLSENKGLLILIICIQTIPSTLLHFGHPMTELISAIPAGIIFGWLVYKTKSIFPAFLLHFAAGIGTDTTILLQHWSTY